MTNQDEIREASKNTDREIWRKIKDDYYSPSIHITERDEVGMNVGGHIIILPIEKWHFLATQVIEAKMPEEKKGRFVVGAQDSGHWVMTEEAEGYNQALHDSRLWQQKCLGELDE